MNLDLSQTQTLLVLFSVELYLSFWQYPCMVAVFSYNYLRRIIRILDKKHNADTCSVGAELWTGGFGRGGADNKYKVHTMLFFLNHRYNNTKTS